jgi:hypothetical protein
VVVDIYNRKNKKEGEKKMVITGVCVWVENEILPG